MSSRSLVQALLSEKKPERPITDLGGRVASLNTSAYLTVKEYLGFGNRIEDETITNLNTIGALDERILRHFEVPFRRVYLRSAGTYQKVTDEKGFFYDEWGTGYLPLGEYVERVEFPLAEATLPDLDSFSWPDPYDPGRISGLEAEVKALYEKSDYSLVAGHISAGIFQDCWNLRGMEQFFVDLVADPEFAHALLARVTEIHIGMWHCFLDVVGNYVDIVETADDLAGQCGPLISPKMYREMLKPYHVALNEAIREKTEAKILYHSCGALLPLIPDLIDIGVDILNPIQPIPGLMNPVELMEKFGDRLIFHGGLDVQHLLPDGTPDQVCEHVNHYFDTFGSDHYIMAPANSVQPGTPARNVVAAFDTARLYE